jgi:transcriptional regulator with XRE-family HTH domain
MVTDTLIPETLLRAASRLGSSQMLARRLGVDHDELRKWMRDESKPSDAMFARVKQVLDAADGEPLNSRSRSK